MDKIIILLLFSIIGLVAKGSAIRCFVCSNCPDASQLGSNEVQDCESPDSTTENPESTTPEGTTVSAIATTETIEGIITQTSPETPPTTTPQVPTPPPVLLGHKYRQVMLDLVGTYQCFVIHHRAGDETQVNRGCVFTRETEEETCTSANDGQAYQFCRLCPYDECNIASRYVVSMAVILSSLLVVWIAN